MVPLMLFFCFVLVISTGCGTSQVSPAPPTPTREADIKVSYNFPTEASTWIELNGALKEIDSTNAFVEASIGQAFKQAFTFSTTNRYAVLVSGVEAFYNFSQPQLTFYTRHNPTNLGIAKLSPQPDRNRRYVWVVSRVGSNVGQFYPPEKDIQFRYAKASAGVWRIVLDQKLQPGEYAIIVPGGRTGYLAYEFSIDGS